MAIVLEAANILLVEDDENLAHWVSDYLVQNGFQVSHVSRGDKVVSYLQYNHIDLILLDVMLPGLNGLEVCKVVRTFTDIPIIMLTAKSEECDEVLGLELGANDYITKPVKPGAMLARIRSQLRLSRSIDTFTSQELTFGNLYINRTSRRVVLCGKEINLSDGLFSLLWLLADNAGHEVSRDSVFNKLLGREYDGLDRRFDVMVSSLRKALNDNPQNPNHIKTVWGKGYLFVPDSWGEN